MLYEKYSDEVISDWYSWIILDWNNVIMAGRDVMDLKNAKLRIPVWDNLY